MSNIKNILSITEGLYRSAILYSTSSIRERKLRPSGFPYCGLKDMFEEITGGPKSTVGFGLDFYGSVGTAAHLIFQKYMGITGKIVGNWECKNVNCSNFKKICKFSVNNLCTCGFFMEYHELTIKNRNIIGHVDCLLLIEGKYYVLDYKTSTLASIEKHKEIGNIFPYTKNVHQILSYCICLERNFNIKIEGWMLMYISRDTPYQVALVGKDFDAPSRRAEKARMNRYNEQFAQASKVIEDSDPAPVKALIDSKPCTSYKHWRSEFGDFDKCPLGSSHVCFQAAKLKQVVNDALESKELRPVQDPNKPPEVIVKAEAISVKRL